VAIAAKTAHTFPAGSVDISKLLAATADTAKGGSLQDSLAEIVTTIR
jgi:hypothetical protein